MSFASPFDHPDVLLSNSSVRNEPRGIVQVPTKIARNRTAEDGLADVRPVVEHLVQCELYFTGSKMIAYENVGRAIGKSESWVRKLIGRHPVAIHYFEYLNIVRAYDALCDRIETAAAAERLRADLFGRLAHAPVERPAGLVAGPQGPARE